MPRASGLISSENASCSGKKHRKKTEKNRITMEAILKRGIPESEARANCYPLSPTSLLSVVNAGTCLLSPSVYAHFREPIVW